jgi:hypothetical protein
MSAFTKPPNDASNAPAPKTEAQPGKPGVPHTSHGPQAPQKPPGPPVVVTRTIDVGPAPPPPAGKGRPAAPTVNVGSTGNTGNLGNVGAPVPAKPAPQPLPPVPPAGAAPVIPPAPPTQKTPTLKMDAAPASVRPAAPSMTADEGITSIHDTFERMLASDLDKGFEAIERKPGAPLTIEGMEVTDLSEVRSLFAQLATNHVRPVRDFLMDLRWSEATVEWIDVCEPSLKSLRRAAEKLELVELCAALDAFAAAMTAARAAGSRTIEGEPRAALIAGHDKLAEVMPQAFALDKERSQRETVILQSLLMQVPGVKKVTTDKLFAAGLTTLEAMLLANPGDIAATTGIDTALATSIANRFRDYHAQVRARVPDATHARERERIAELTSQLRQEHEQYEAAARSWTRDAEEKKKALRVARERTVLELQVMLARLGEVERARELDRLPFEAKLSRLESFLEEARDKYVTPA